MKPSIEENYYFHYMYAIDLESALSSIKLIRRYKRLEVQHALLRDATIAYVRPFSKNKGRLGKHELGVKGIVPNDMRALHEELYSLRAQQFAHTDLTFYKPTTILFGNELCGMMYNSFSLNGLLKKLPDIEALVLAVALSVKTKIDEYEGTRRQHEHVEAINVKIPPGDPLGLL